MRPACIRISARSTAARTVSGVISPGVGHHLVNSVGRTAPRTLPLFTSPLKCPAMSSALP